jgi:chitin synthase
LLINVITFRKVEGEAKDKGHGAGAGIFDGQSVPLRRWEDWERSRLRKLRREEKRRREMDRAHPSGYYGDGNLLSTRGADTHSQYDGSDTFSVNSSEDDHWGPEIGAYNENNTSFPPPPVGLHVVPETLQNAKTLGTADLEAMLEMGFDDRPEPDSQYQSVRTPQDGTFASRYKLSDSAPQRGNGYTPLERTISPGGLPPSPSFISPISPNAPLPSVNGVSSAIGGNGDWKTHIKKRSGGRSRPSKEEYGPLGPLDPGGKF